VQHARKISEFLRSQLRFNGRASPGLHIEASPT